MRLPTFSRRSSTDTADDERPTMASGAATRGATVAPPTESTTTRWADRDRADAYRAEERGAERARAERDAANRDANLRPADEDPDRTERFDRVTDDTHPTGAVRAGDRTGEQPAMVAGPKPRASLLATLSLILAVAGGMLVLSGPLLGYGIGVAALALILSLFGIRATRRRHVAGKTDAMIAMVVSLAAIVVGVLALTGSLSWLGTDKQPVSDLRHWLDTRFANRF